MLAPHAVTFSPKSHGRECPIVESRQRFQWSPAVAQRREAERAAARRAGGAMPIPFHG
jgi:hypothetical protein